MNGYMLASVDVGGSSDPEGYSVGIVRKVDRITKVQIVRLGAMSPPRTPTATVNLCADLMKGLRERFNSGPIRFVVDLSSNSAVGHLLANALPRDALIGVKIHGADQHGAGVVALPVGEVAGRSTALPCLTFSRRQLLLDLNSAFLHRLIALPLDDEAERPGLQMLRDQMSRASLKTTPAGRQIAIVARGNDDVVLSVAMLWATAVRLPPPRNPNASNRNRVSNRSPDGGYPWT